MIVTVTLNAAFDRTITVPNFQRGQRHRASAGLPLAGGKGINVARALKTLGVPVVATGLAGGQAGLADRRAAHRRGDPQRLRPHRGRVAHVDRGRRPDRATATPRSTSGARPCSPRSSSSCSRSSATSRRARARRLRRLAAARRRRRLLRRGDPRPRAPPGPVGARLRGRAAAARVEAEPFLVSPNQREAEALVGQEFHDDEDFQLALDQIAELGRAQRAHHDRDAAATRCCARTATAHRYRAVAPRVEPVSARRLAATRCSRRSSPRATRGRGARGVRCAPRSPPVPRRRSSSAPAASTRARPAGSRPASSVSELEPQVAAP